MAGEIIRKGDSTSHGGEVLEGSLIDICHGKPIAFIGHKTYCPKCRGDFPIVEGVFSTNFYGKGVAVAGMKTACGAVLVASQFTDTVLCGTPGSAKHADSALSSGNGDVAAYRAESSINISPPKNDEIELYDDKFILRDQNGDPLSNAAYAILRSSGEMEYGETDRFGHTHLLAATNESEIVNIYLAG